MNKNNRIRRSGFTLIELLLVMAIIAVLASIVMPRLGNSRAKADKAKAIAEIDSLKLAVNNFNVDMGRFPTTLDELVNKVEPVGNHTWGGPYMEKSTIPLDPWGRPYVYQTPGTNNPDFDLYSNGPDGQTRIEP